MRTRVPCDQQVPSAGCLLAIPQHALVPRTPSLSLLALLHLLLNLAHLAAQRCDGAGQALCLGSALGARPCLALCPPHRLLQLGVVLLQVLFKPSGVGLQGPLRGLQGAAAG